MHLMQKSWLRVYHRFLPKLKHKKPFSDQAVLRFLLVLVLVLAILAGYYQVISKQERKRYLRLEDKYVRVRNQLGREKMQLLINQSYDD